MIDCYVDEKYYYILNELGVTDLFSYEINIYYTYMYIHIFMYLYICVCITNLFFFCLFDRFGNVIIRKKCLCVVCTEKIVEKKKLSENIAKEIVRYLLQTLVKLHRNDMVKIKQKCKKRGGKGGGKKKKKKKVIGMCVI
ncbi:hypothetical protein RFI_01623 [Reticulomyxa filosa]|uniref:Uncharacterized protein n=1 Tax=Reticulomyxa filosa TaxID=46433 RepID=X6PA89_RETFI|nr:hypothetical protein RFI_01623 [Reticulomyxa filosa]|eukprot:ETO35440.1 hypothetical protein RFI_01623 [Reticulomyxa filosa]